MGRPIFPRARLEWAVVAGFAVCVSVLLAHHEPWRDELQAWLLARDSASLLDLWRNSRYEGHPLLWHLLLFPLTRWVGHPAAMQVLHGVIAVAAAAAVVRLAPFPLPVRAAIVFSYFPLFEYGAISRNYALTILGLWLATAALARGHPVAAGMGGVLAANSSPMGTVLQVALAAAVAMVARGRRVRAAALAVLAVGTGLAVWQIIPAPDYQHARAWVWWWDASRALWVTRGFARALLPLQQPGLHFWESSPLFPLHWPAGFVPAAAALVAAFAGLGWALRRSPAASAMWLLGTSSLFAFAYVKFPGAARHHGFLWVLLVASVWLAVARGEVSSRLAAWLLAPSLVAGMAGAATAAWYEVREPFSGARCAAAQIVAAGLEGRPVVGGLDYAASGVAAYHRRGRLFYPARGEWGSFLLWDPRRLPQDSLTPEEVIAAGRGVNEGQGFVALLHSPLAAPADLGCELVAVCAPTIVADEAQWVYLCGPAVIGPEAGED